MSTRKEALKFTYKGNTTSAKKLQMIYGLDTGHVLLDNI